MTYNYSPTQNNRRITSSVDAVTGENVSYTYDSLNRLIAASTSGTAGVQWGNSYSYDGFGNLTSKVVTKGTAPQVYPIVNSAKNQARMSGDYGFDANGNWMGTSTSPNTWNVENQLISNGSVDGAGYPLTYTYDPWGKRVLQADNYDGVNAIYFYSITGQRLATYSLYTAPLQVYPGSVSQYFGKRRLVPMDRLGSVRNNSGQPVAYYPWGEERTSTPDGTDKFATYFRDITSDGMGEDYANARYYNNNFGRFWSPDRWYGGKIHNPQSLNRYTYAGNDPVDRSDPTGMDDSTSTEPGETSDPEGGHTMTPPSIFNNCFTMFAALSQGTPEYGYDEQFGSVLEACEHAIGSATGLSFSSSGATLTVVGAGSTVNAASTTATASSLASGNAQLPLFTDANTLYTGQYTGAGSQMTGLAGRITINPAVLADPSALSVYSTSPPTAAGDNTRSSFLFSQLTTGTFNFSPQTGLGSAAQPFNGTVTNYLQQFISQQGNASTQATQLQQGQSVVVATLQQKFNSTSAVNIDTEMANLIQVQNTYAANAHIMSVVQSMMQSLLQA